MELLNSITAFLTKLFQWWFTVMPWEQALLIRRGKTVRLLGAGLYFKIPFIDTVYLQTTRMRMVDTPMQTISTKDGSTITIKLAIGYRIDNIQTLYNKLYHPEMTINSMAMGFVGEYVRDNDLTEITPLNVEKFVNKGISAESFGLNDLNVKITTFATVQTYRLIQDGSSLYEGLNMEPKK
jgi:regulator of protease activity HflC (stomatin/prohibitin superfamily)